MIKASQVEVKDTAGGTVIQGDEDETLAASNLQIKNRHASDSVFIGGEGVTAANGFELKPADPPLVLTLSRGETVRGITAAGKTVVVHVLETGD